MSWYAVAAAFVAAVGSAYQQNEVAKKQDRDVTQGILQRMKSTREQSDAMQKSLASLRDSNSKTAVAQATGDYLRQLGAPRPAGTSSQPATVGALSDAYRTAAGAANTASTAQAAKTAGLLAVTDAPGIQRQAENVKIGQLSSALGRIGIAGDDAVNQAQLRARGERPNPWIGLATSALAAYGKSAGTGGAGSTAGSTSGYGLGDYGGMGSGGEQAYIGDGSLNGTWGQNAAGLFGNGKSLNGY